MQEAKLRTTKSVFRNQWSLEAIADFAATSYNFSSNLAMNPQFVL